MTLEEIRARRAKGWRSVDDNGADADWLLAYVDVLEEKVNQLEQERDAFRTRAGLD